MAAVAASLASLLGLGATAVRIVRKLKFQSEREVPCEGQTDEVKVSELVVFGQLHRLNQSSRHTDQHKADVDRLDTNQPSRLRLRSPPQKI